MQRSTYDTWAGLFIGPLLFVISLPILARQAAREGDRTVLWLLVIALLVKLGGAMLRHYVTFQVYERADATGYHEAGVVISEQFRRGDFQTGLASLTGTHFIRFFTGVVYTIIRPTRLGGFMVFSWLGFWGLFFFYRAYVKAMPEGRSRSYARLLFFMPSLFFWPSSIGKESWMTFSLGIAAFGVALMMARNAGRGLAVTGLGLWLAALVRPHIAGLVGLALIGGYLLYRSRDDSRPLAPIAKLYSLAALIALSVLLIQQTDRFLEHSGIETQKGTTNVLGQITERTSAGDSEFVPSILESPFRAPIAAFTVVFRPHLLEAHNAQSLASALEGTFLLLLTLLRLRWGMAALGSIRRQSYVAFALLYAGLFIFAFSGVANFGLLVRERVQVLPLILILLTVPPKRLHRVAEEP
jgi:hypothetical protein